MVTENPAALWYLLALIPLLIVLILGYQRSRSAIQMLGGSWRYRSLLNVLLVKTFFGRLFFLLFFVFAVFSLMDIQWGSRLAEDDRVDFEIVFAVDVSRSMLARDVEPSRLARTLSEIERFVLTHERSQSDRANSRYGIVVFKGEAYCVMPVTEDLHSFKVILNSLSPDMMTSKGSDLEAGLRKALETLKTAGRFSLVMLFTDGESLTGKPLYAAKQAAKRDVPIITIALGTEQGSEIVLKDGSRVYDTKSKSVVTRLNRNLLEEIAAISRGRVYLIEDMDRLRSELVSILKNLEPGERQRGLKLARKSLYRLFLSLGLVFLALSVIVRGVRWRGAA
jgi:Ca-activated chloride channel family protein